MGYARHIGRVGALAVALGVGAAVASTPGIAIADPSDSAAASDSSSSTSSATSAGTNEKDSDPKPPSNPTDKGDDAEDTEAAADDEPADAEDTDADTEDADSAAEETEAPVPAVTDESTLPIVDEEVTPQVEVPASHNDGRVRDSDGPPPASTPQPTGADPTTATVEPAVADDDEVLPQPEAISLTAAVDVVDGETAVPATTALATSTTVVPAPAVPVPPRTLVGAVTHFVASVLEPLLTLGENSPIQIPLLTAALSLVRNEFDKILGPRRTNIGSEQTVSLVTDTAPQPSVLADPTRPRVLVIGVDGTNLSRILADDYNQNFFDLMGVSTTAASSIVGHTTISGPSWSAILTGVWGERTGVINNVFTPWTYNTWPTVFNQLESIDRDIQTMAVGNWDVINAIAGAGSIPVDTNLYVAQLEGDTNWLATDDRVADLTVEAISGAGGAVTPNFLFSYFVGVDENGHLYGGASEEYKLAIRNMDDNLGEILDAVAAREALGEDWTVMMVTDHGHQPQVGFGHGFQSPDETSTFVIAEGTDFGDGLINSQYEIVDITPTVVSLFGGTPRAGSDGVSLTTLGGGDVDPVDLKQALRDAIAENDYPDTVTQLRLGLRTIFATVPYYIFTYGDDIVAAVPNFLAGPVDFLLDGLYVATNVPAQIVAFLTGVSGASIFPLLPPAAPSFPPAEDAMLPDSVLVVSCGASGSTAESYCGAASVA